MAKGIKEKYFALAREVDAEHKRKYPGETKKKKARALYTTQPYNYRNS